MSSLEADKVKLSQALHSEVECFNFDMVSELLRKGADPNARDPEGYSPLHRIVNSLLKINSNASVKMARLLLDSGALVEATDSSCLSVLETSIKAGSLEIVDVLLEYGVDINCEYSAFTPLIWSAFYGKDDVMKLLLGKGAQVNKCRSFDESTALHWAVRYRYKQCVKILLLQQGVDVNAKDRDGRSPFHYAAGVYGFLDILSDLVNHVGIYPNSSLANDGKAGVSRKESALEISSGPLKGSSIPFSKCGVDINLKDKKGRSALHLAAESGRSKKVVKALLSLGADVNDRDATRNTPLMMSVGSSRKTTSILLQHGADVDAINEDGMSALFLVFEHFDSWDESLPVLLEYGADVNIIANGRDRFTPLLYAEYMYNVNALPRGASSPYQSANVRKDGRRVLELCRHIIKLKTANEFSVNESNSRSRYLGHPSLLELQTCCEKELAMLRIARVADSYLSLYDFLTREPNVLARCCQRESVATFLESRKRESAYPVYKLLLKFRFGMALERSRLIDEAMLAGMKIFSVLPNLCVDAICNNLRNVDLKNLIEVSRPCV